MDKLDIVKSVYIIYCAADIKHGDAKYMKDKDMYAIMHHPVGHPDIEYCLKKDGIAEEKILFKVDCCIVLGQSGGIKLDEDLFFYNVEARAHEEVQFFFKCDDINKFAARLKKECAKIIKKYSKYVQDYSAKKDDAEK